MPITAISAIVATSTLLDSTSSTRRPSARDPLNASLATLSSPFEVSNIYHIDGMTATARARDLVRGSYDLHVHVDPDVIGRIVDDVTLATRFASWGLAGFGLKSHYTSTAERARVVNRVALGARAIGTLTLNAAVGGLNPVAVEIAAREGARIVWLPTVDSVNEAGRATVATSIRRCG